MPLVFFCAVWYDVTKWVRRARARRTKGTSMNYDYLIEAINASLLVILLLWLALDGTRRTNRRQLVWCVFLTLLVVAAETGCLLTDNAAPHERGWSILFNCVGFTLTPLVLIVESDLYAEDKKKYPWHYLPAAVNAVFTLLSPFFGGIFYVTEENTYHRGDFFEVYFFAFLFSIFYSALRKLLLVRRLPTALFVKIIVSNAAVLVGALYQVLHPQFHITWLTVSIYLSLVYSFLKEMEGMLDRLTGLLNQNAFQLMTAPEGHGELHAHTAAVVVLDIDHFKHINDTRGHLQGDEYIRQVARVLKLAFGNHKLFRVGGDEFAALLPNGTETEVCRCLERAEQLIEKQRRRDTAFPTISYGYAFAASPHAIGQTVKRADELMYEQKKRKEAERLITQ